MARLDLRHWLIALIGLACGAASAATLHGIGTIG